MKIRVGPVRADKRNFTQSDAEPNTIYIKLNQAKKVSYTLFNMNGN